MQLIITVLGENHPELIVELARSVRDAKCTILESRISELGLQLAAYLRVEGNWNHIVRLENALESSTHRFTLKVTTLRCREEEMSEKEDGLPYTIDIFATDQIHHLYEVSTFLADRGIGIIDMSTNRYPASLTGSPIFFAHLVIKIPTTLRIVALRDEFLDFCDKTNIDAILEPLKH